MKIIKLFLLLSLGLWAEFYANVPNEIDDEQMRYIIKNGWNDQNKTLNELIINYGDKIMPEVLQVMKKPLIEVKPTEETPFSLPKIFMNRSDYLHILSYAKYLERNNKVEESFDIHLKALEGLNNIKYVSMFSLIYRSVIEMIVVESLQQSLQAQNYISLQKKEILQIRLKSLLLLNEGYFDAVMASEKEVVLISFKKDLIDVKTLDEFVAKNEQDYNDEIFEYFNKDLLKAFFEDKVVMQKALDSLEDELDTYFNRLKFVKNYDQYLALEAEYETSLKEYGEKFIKDAESGKKYQFSKEEFIEVVDKTMFVYSKIYKIGKVKIDYLRNIKNNKALIKSLEK